MTRKKGRSALKSNTVKLNFSEPDNQEPWPIEKAYSAPPGLGYRDSRLSIIFLKRTVLRLNPRQYTSVLQTVRQILCSAQDFASRPSARYAHLKGDSFSHARKAAQVRVF